MIDQVLKESINNKIQNGDFSTADLPVFFTLFCQIGNENEEFQEEVKGWRQRIRLELSGLGQVGIVVADGVVTSSPGIIEEPDLTFTISAAEAAPIFSGEKDAESAFVSGALIVSGDLLDALKLQTLIEIVADEIAY